MFVREKLNVLCNILRQKNYYKFKFIHLIRLKANVEGEASPLHWMNLVSERLKGYSIMSMGEENAPI